jgi:hypothetical protein
MTKHIATIDGPPGTDLMGAPDNPVPAQTFGELETMLGKAKLTGAPDTARYRIRVTLGGKVKQLILEWED